MSESSNTPTEDWTPDKPSVPVHIRGRDLPTVRERFDSERIGVRETRPVLHVGTEPTPDLDTFVLAYRIDWPQPPHEASLEAVVVRLLHGAGIHARVNGHEIGK